MQYSHLYHTVWISDANVQRILNETFSLYLVHIPKFQIEEINETALYEKIVRMETKISSMNAMFLQHIVDADTEIKRIRESVVRQCGNCSSE